jgi:hypothetical protein
LWIFGYSKQFTDFIKDLDGDHRNSIEDVAQIKLFGKRYATQYPHIEKLIKLNKHYNLDNAVEILSSILTLKKELEKLERNRTIVLETKKRFGKENIMNKINKMSEQIFSNKINILKYTKISLNEAIDHATKDLNDKISKHVRKLENLPVELMLDSFKQFKQIELEKSLLREELYMKNLSKAVSKYGVNNWKIWMSQKHFDPRAMIFLQEKSVVFDVDFRVNREKNREKSRKSAAVKQRSADFQDFSRFFERLTRKDIENYGLFLF